ncbi:hypothetical protein CAC42_5343 [Sphaceloma murrayae]|uniref:Copper transport protein n=1 Tax=Sphaceloma murrayae TaxID=2082308 RepID=A0A2K1QUR2_9PEZI|nr:hypothetical protein CAC42_5343 [Sphaceloma murrayae]
MSMSMSMPMSGTSSSSMSTSTGMSHGSGGTSHGSSQSSSSSSTSDSGHSSMMAMSDMMMTFFTSTSTALYSEDWTPNSTGQYAGTCIFLIALCILFRALVAIRANFVELSYNYRHRHEPSWKHTQIDAKGTGKLKSGQKRFAWLIEEAIPRAVLDTVLAGTSYLLMLAVMTMNVGYFLSILAGTFLGSLCLGQYTGSAPLAH